MKPEVVVASFLRSAKHYSYEEAVVALNDLVEERDALRGEVEALNNKLAVALDESIRAATENERLKADLADLQEDVNDANRFGDDVEKLKQAIAQQDRAALVERCIEAAKEITHDHYCGAGYTGCDCRVDIIRELNSLDRAKLLSEEEGTT